MGRWGHDSDSDWNGFDPATLASPETLRKTRKARRERARIDDPTPVRRAETQTGRAFKPSGDAIKRAIKLVILEEPGISVRDILAELQKRVGMVDVSIVTLTNIRAEFRQTLKFLKERGHLKGVDI